MARHARTWNFTPCARLNVIFILLAWSISIFQLDASDGTTPSSGVPLIPSIPGKFRSPAATRPSKTRSLAKNSFGRYECGFMGPTSLPSRKRPDGVEGEMTIVVFVLVWAVALPRRRVRRIERLIACSKLCIMTWKAAIIGSRHALRENLRFSTALFVTTFTVRRQLAAAQAE